MMYRKIFLSLVLIAMLVLPLGAQYSKGVPAGIRITNWAQVYLGTNLYSYTNIATNVIAIYGMSDVTADTQGNIFPGGFILLTNYVTNNANTNIILRISLSNFTMNGGYSGSDWRATLLNLTSQTVVGTASTQVRVSTNLSYGNVFSFIIRVETAADSYPGDWGTLPVVLSMTGGNTNLYVRYQGDNGNWYGGTNIHLYYPRITITGPYIVLRKLLAISNTPPYLAMGGVPDIPVPDAVISYTNLYDNDGLSGATNLIIIDTIPRHTDFIVGSINLNVHSIAGANYAVEYYNRNTMIWGYVPAGSPPYNADPNVGRIRIRFTGPSVAPNENSEGTDTIGIADGDVPDQDAGRMWYKVVVHRRE
ncbi:MAG: hypothetical protein JW827_03790 [Spirochaetes bacterium]|nr:hypothetical protein [Spirochaetota bacterium]